MSNFIYKLCAHQAYIYVKMATNRKKVKEGKYFKTLSLVYLDEQTGGSFDFFPFFFYFTVFFKYSIDFF